MTFGAFNQTLITFASVSFQSNNKYHLIGFGQ